VKTDEADLHLENRSVRYMLHGSGSWELRGVGVVARSLDLLIGPWSQRSRHYARNIEALNVGRSL